MSDQKPRTEAEILAGWRALQQKQDATTGDRSEGWQERSAQLAEREIDLISEARRLPEMPAEIAACLPGYACAYLRRFADDMRRQP